MIREALMRAGLVAIMGCGLSCTSAAGKAPPQAERAAPVQAESKSLQPVAPSPLAVGRPSAAPASTFANGPTTGPSSLQVKRFVVTTAVTEREPHGGALPLRADGSAIFAFAELANPGRHSENVRITFERKAGAERVGNVTLPVPGQVGRHRTWAMTRFIRAAGVWDAVLWSESGQELGRTSFEVSAS